MRIILVDDEKPARDYCKKLLTELFPHCILVDETADVNSAYESILIHNPDVVLLDVDLPDGTAFDLLKRFPQINFNVIFITAHEEYALQAIKFSALDFLLKPYTSGEFADAIRKALNKKEQNDLQVRYSTLFQNIQTQHQPAKIVLRTADTIHVVALDDIVRIEADGAYTSFYLTNRKPITVSKNLKEYDKMLEYNGFIRTHQSHLVNQKHLICYYKSDGGLLGMSDLSRVPVATRFKDKVIKQLEQL